MSTVAMLGVGDCRIAAIADQACLQIVNSDQIAPGKTQIWTQAQHRPGTFLTNQTNQQ